MEADRARALVTALLAWYDGVRRDLPWRRTRDPYAVWLSEIMLQQTRVETVIPYYERFVSTLPTVFALAEAPSDQVMSLWSGLGYYRRARFLHEAAQQIVRDESGAFPRDVAGLRRVRGIGRYTAGAIASIAFGARAALVDGNVARVLARVFAVTADVRGGPGLEAIWSLAEALVPESRPGDWNQALMELGATTCIPQTPRCLVCPWKDACEGRAQGLERELPCLKPKTKPVAASRTAIVATHRGAVLLGRRHSGGLFGGLWEPPTLEEAPSDEETCTALGHRLGVGLANPTFAGDVTHVLSHRRLQTRVLVCRLPRRPRPATLADAVYDRVALVDAAEFATLGMATSTRKVLEAAGAWPNGDGANGK